MIELIYRAAGVFRLHRPRTDAGRLAQDLADRYLRRHGCTVVARHYRARSGAGEIDLVACQGGALVFVEVKACTTDDYRTPDCAEPGETRQMLERTAREYVRRRGLKWIHTRFDVVSVLLGRPVRVDWQRGVFP